MLYSTLKCKILTSLLKKRILRVFLTKGCHVILLYHCSHEKGFSNEMDPFYAHGNKYTVYTSGTNFNRTILKIIKNPLFLQLFQLIRPSECIQKIHRFFLHFPWNSAFEQKRKVPPQRKLKKG